MRRQADRAFRDQLIDNMLVFMGDIALQDARTDEIGKCGWHRPVIHDGPTSSVRRLLRDLHDAEKTLTAATLSIAQCCESVQPRWPICCATARRTCPATSRSAR